MGPEGVDLHQQERKKDWRENGYDRRKELDACHCDDEFENVEEGEDANASKESEEFEPCAEAGELFEKWAYTKT